LLKVLAYGPRAVPVSLESWRPPLKSNCEARITGFRDGGLGQKVRGANPPETDNTLAFGRSMKAANLRFFLKFGNAKSQI